MDQITVVYDAFGDVPGLVRDWGLALFLEVGGRRILFDTGNDSDVFARNVRALGIDLADLDAVVISHRHGDHTSGLRHLLESNPDVPIHVPAELFGVFGSVLPDDFSPQVEDLPRRMRYFGGEPPIARPTGTPWPGANFVPTDRASEILPGVVVVPTVSARPGTRELRELALVLSTDRGAVVVVGCSHPGIEEVLDACSAVRPELDLRLVVGGLHLVRSPGEEVTRVARSLHDRWRPDRIAPGHCTGEPAFAELKALFGERYEYAGLGAVLPV